MSSNDLDIIILSFARDSNIKIMFQLVVLFILTPQLIQWQEYSCDYHETINCYYITVTNTWLSKGLVDIWSTLVHC
jgi:hypothetical protein